MRKYQGGYYEQENNRCIEQGPGRELAAIVQYMKHHYEGEGMESPAVLEIFKSTAKDEMKHAENLARGSSILAECLQRNLNQ